MKTKEELIAFENWTVETFNNGLLKSPVHLSGGNEDQLIEIFKDIKPQDWVFTTYRSHYHALLKGVPEQRLKDWILDNKSIHFMDSEYKVFSSAIVGGTLPIALGTAMAIKKKYSEERELIKETIENLKIEGAKITHVTIETPKEPHVYCFIGDMTASLGVFNDCLSYAENFDLPITFIIENNDLSTDTNTGKVWGIDSNYFDSYFEKLENRSENVIHYRYTRVWPHYGTGKFISSIWTDIIKENDVRNKGF